MRLFILSIGLMGFFFFSACQDSPKNPPPSSNEQSPQTTEKTTTPAEANQRKTNEPEFDQQEIDDIHPETIIDKLEAYYKDLEAKKLDESLYFAPVVEQFYSQENQPREKIGAIIRGGFEGIISRQVSLDPQSYRFSQDGNRYTCEFSGTVNIQRRGEKVAQEESFQNRFVFNENYLIVSYGPALAAKQVNIPTNAAEIAKETIEQFLTALSELDYKRANQFIHPTYKMRYITRPGAYDVIYEVTSFSEVVAYSAWMEKHFSAMNCEFKHEKLPEFDCETFDKQGCFIDEVENFDRLVNNMQALSEAELSSYTDGEMNAAMDIQELIQLEFANTAQTTAMYFGNIDGKWYILVLDRAIYDCSA